jgi:hypothetical protein
MREAAEACRDVAIAFILLAAPDSPFFCATARSSVSLPNQ